MPRMGRNYRISYRDWKANYERAKTTVEKAIRRIKRGDRIFIGTGCGEPQELVRALWKDAGRIEDAEIFHLLGMGEQTCDEECTAKVFRHNSFFIGPSTRLAVWEGRADYIPIMLSDIPLLFKNGRLPIDVSLIQVSPPDSHGFCTYGVSVDVVKAATETAGLVIAQVNPRMPQTMGNSFIHINDLDLVVEHEEKLLEWTYPEPHEVHMKVAENVARLITDGTTLQMGIGTIPNMTLGFLKDRLNLGVHTEVFSDGLVDLIEAGAVTCARKSIHVGEIITSFCMGTARLYDYISGNRFFAFHPSEYCNNLRIIAKNDRLAAINVALEVDLTGQVNSDSLGFQFFSGIGGQADFIRGAALSRKGKPIIALPSTTLDGKHSRIVPMLSEGAGVVTNRGDVHYVVTEYGIAYLHGKNIRERAMALISIAHPDVRPDLLAFAKDKKYVYADQILPPKDGIIYPAEFETRLKAENGVQLLIRPIKFTDEAMVRDMFYDLSEESIYMRFFAHVKSMPHEKAQLLVNLDYMEQMSIGAFSGEDPDYRMAAMAQYMRSPRTNLAEVALLVRDDWQKMGLGRFLFTYLVRIARQRGIEGFTAEVLPENFAMIRIIQNSGFKVTTRFDEDSHYYEMLFDSASFAEQPVRPMSEEID